MNPRGIARAIDSALERRARRTRANERGKVVDVDSDTGNMVVDYNGTELTFPIAGAIPSIGDQVTIQRTTAGLSIADRSAYGGG